MSHAVDELLEPLRHADRRGAVIATATRHGLILGLVCVLVWIAVPGWLAVTAAVGGAAFVLAVAIDAWRRRFDPVQVDRQLGLDDRLRTWTELRSRAAVPRSLPWLERELASRLCAVDPAARRRLGHRGLGPWSILVWAILALLLLRAFLPVMPEGPLELAGRGPEGAAGSNGSGGGGGAGVPDDAPSSGAADSGEAEPDEGDVPPPPPPEPGPGSPEQPPPEPGDEPSLELPPEPVVDRPTEDAFQVPQFIGAGQGELREAPTIGLEERAPSGGSTPESTAPPPTPVGAGEAEEPPASPPDVDWQRALERALDSRHVPPDERRHVQDYFRRLAERDR